MGGMRFEEFDLGNLGDLLGGMFGGGGRRAASRQPIRGNDLETHVRISFEDSLKGVQVRVPVEVETACTVCHGTGAEPGTAPITCPQCGGRGVVSDSQGLFAFSQPCPRCRGNGTIVENPCRHCRGSGRERVTKRYAVKIPAGAKPGTRVRLKGKGEAGHNAGPAGDLFVVVDVEPSRAVRATRIRPPARRAGDVRRGGARRIGRDPDSRGTGLAQGAERHREREAPPRQGPRRTASQGERARRPVSRESRSPCPRSSRRQRREALEGYQKVSREQPREVFAQ